MTDITIHNVVKVQVKEIEYWKSTYCGNYYCCKLIITFNTHETKDGKFIEEETEIMMFSQHSKDKESYDFKDLIELPRTIIKEHND